MNLELQEAVFTELRSILGSDSEASQPVVESISIGFWQNLMRWVKQIAQTPEPFTIALSGASGSGKSFIREVLVHKLSLVSTVSSFTQDNYYRDFEADFPHLGLEKFYHEINLDDPNHVRFDHLVRDLKRLKAASYGEKLGMPKLRYGTPTTKPTIIPNGLEVEVAPFIITEGIHAFYDTDTLPLYDLKIFVDINEQHRRQRWLERNHLENRGTTDNMWNTTVDCLKRYTLPTRQHADLIVNNNAQVDQVIRFIDDIIGALVGTAERFRQAA